MKKTAEEIALSGWLPCDPPRVTLGFRWPPREIVKCKSCNGRGHIWCYDQGYGKAYGQCYKKRCSCRGGKQAEVHLDKEFRVAVQWFQASTPPAEQFEYWLWKDVWQVIENPAQYWEELRAEIASGNVYRLEAIRDDVVRLHQLCVLAHEDF